MGEGLKAVQRNTHAPAASQRATRAHSSQRLALSIELHIFLADSPAPTVRTWQSAIESAAFPLVLDVECDLASHRGFLPAKYDGKQTGFEFYLDGASDILVAYPHVAARVGQHTRCATFRWGGDLLEMCAALSAAASLAKLTKGLYFYPDDDVIYDADEALIATRNDLKSVPL
jgi:hypothetical protein